MLLAAGLLCAPLAWAALLQTNYVLSYVACEHRHVWMLHAAALAAIAVAAAGWLAARRVARSEPTLSGTLDSASAPIRTMATAGEWLSLWFVLVIAATEIPVFLLPPCTP